MSGTFEWAFWRWAFWLRFNDIGVHAQIDRPRYFSERHGLRRVRRLGRVSLEVFRRDAEVRGPLRRPALLRLVR